MATKKEATDEPKTTTPRRKTPRRKAGSQALPAKSAKSGSKSSRSKTTTRPPVEDAEPENETTPGSDGPAPKVHEVKDGHCRFASCDERVGGSDWVMSEEQVESHDSVSGCFTTGGVTDGYVSRCKSVCPHCDRCQFCGRDWS